MNKIEIEVPYNVRYISEWNDFNINLLLGHSIINKTVTGCGFTHYCLTNNIPTILCSPRKFLLENKHEQLENTYLVINKGERGVFIDSEEIVKVSDPIKSLFNKTNKKAETSGSDYSEICLIQDNLRSYILNCQLSQQPTKILVTYDSLKYVLSVLGDTIQYYSIIVDEFQNIFMDASFKADTELNFINTLQDCPNVTYLSATPYIEEYLNELDEFKDLPYYEFVWHPDRLQTIKVDMRKTFNLSKEVDKIIQDYLQGHFPEKVDEKGIVHQSREVVFFTNSVKLITSTIIRNNLTPEQVNIICADTEKNKETLKKLGISIGSAPLEGKSHKMFTFCTRTTYAGADFYSTSALSVIVSDCKINALSTDIRMDFPQIMGRQRLSTNVFRDECIFIYKLSDSVVTMDEFERISQEKLKKSEKDIKNGKLIGLSDSKDNILEDIRLRIKVKKYSDDYTGINEKTGELTINKLVYISEKRAFELRSDVYKSDVQVYNEFIEFTSGLLSIEEGLERKALLNQTREKCKKGSFEDRMRLVCDILLNPRWFGKIHISDFYWLPIKYRNLLNQVGPERIRANGHIEAVIDREILMNSRKLYLKEIIINQFKVGEKYFLRDIKSILKNIYLTNEVTQKPKATDILEYFEVREYISLDKETGKRLGGYEIIKIKD